MQVVGYIAGAVDCEAERTRAAHLGLRVLDRGERG